jgi:DNA-binding HxlR family transcriptional regulator
MKPKCTVYRTIDFISKRWAVLIVQELYRQGETKRRFSDLKLSLPNITAKILSARLKELEKEGLIKKDIYKDEIPLRCEYSLTRMGDDFIKIIKDIKQWALKWKFDNKECQEKDCKQCGI